MPSTDYNIVKETSGDYAGLYCLRIFERGQRESTTFVLGRNAHLFPTYDAALDWYEREN